MVIVFLYKKLSENEKSEDAIPRDHPKTDVYYTDLNIIFLSLFVL